MLNRDSPDDARALPPPSAVLALAAGLAGQSRSALAAAKPATVEVTFVREGRFVRVERVVPKRSAARAARAPRAPPGAHEGRAGEGSAIRFPAGCPRAARFAVWTISGASGSPVRCSAPRRREPWIGASPRSRRRSRVSARSASRRSRPRAASSRPSASVSGRAPGAPFAARRATRTAFAEFRCGSGRSDSSIARR